MLASACWRHVQRAPTEFTVAQMELRAWLLWVSVLQFDTSYFLDPPTLSSPIEHMKQEISKTIIIGSSSICLAAA